MIQIFRGKDSYCIRTTCLDTESFIADLAEALQAVSAEANGDGGIAMMGVLNQAMPIAFKLAGYKADTVQEQRTLVCGSIMPHESDLIATAGR
jgi:hypothetical protein